MEPINLIYKKKLHSFFKKIIFINLFFIVFITVFAFYVQSYLHREFARKLISGVHSEILTGDIKTAQRLLIKLSSDIFNRIEYYDLNNKLFLVKDSEVSSDFFQSSIRLFVGLTENTHVGHLAFYYSLDYVILISAVIFILQVLVIYLYVKRYQLKLDSDLTRDRIFVQDLNFAETARQVAHDIRSPYAVLMSCTQSLPGIPADQKKAIDLSVTRIGDILFDLEKGRRSGAIGINNLKEQNNLNPEYLESVTEKLIVLTLLDQNISEKRFQYKKTSGVDVALDFQAELSVAFEVCPKVFSRILSNLIDNSVQAKSETRQLDIAIVVRITDQRMLSIEVKDNGVGIPEENIPKLFQQGATFGKETGTGLGLYYSRKQVESWGGNISLSSALNVGTTIKIELPMVPSPSWFFSDFNSFKDKTILVVDDDPSIHQFWKNRLKECNLLFAKNPEEARSFLSELPDFYIFDYELLGSETTGLDLAREWGVGSDAVLVTSYYADSKIQEACQIIGMKITPKQILNWI